MIHKTIAQNAGSRGWENSRGCEWGYCRVDHWSWSVEDSPDDGSPWVIGVATISTIVEVVAGLNSPAGGEGEEKEKYRY